MDRLVATRPNVRLARRHDRTYLRSIIHCCTREVMALDDQPEARDEQLDDVVEPPELGVPVALVVSRPRAKVAIVEEELEPVQTLSSSMTAAIASNSRTSCGFDSSRSGVASEDAALAAAGQAGASSATIYRGVYELM